MWKRCCAGSLNKDPDQRYYSALEFARAMQRVQFAYFGHALPLPWKDAGYPKDIERRRRATDQRDQITPFVTAMGQTGGYYRRYTCGDHRSGTDIRLRGRSPHGQRHRIRYQTGGDARHQG